MTKKKKTIEEIDVDLALFRQKWIDAKPKEKFGWMSKIDSLLDQRNLIEKERVKS